MARANPALLHRIRNRKAHQEALGRPHRRRGRLPRQLPPKAIELAYSAELVAMLERARALVRASLFPVLAQLLSAGAAARGDTSRGEWPETGGKGPPSPSPLFRLDVDPKDVNRIMEGLSEQWFREFPRNRLESVSRKYGERTADFQREELNKQLRAAVGVDVFAAEPHLLPRVEAFTAENVALIQTLPQRYFDEVERLVISSVRDGTRPEELAVALEDRFDVSESRARLIATDQTLKFFGELNQVRQQALGMDSYIWRTSKDERVRGRPDGKYPKARYSHWAREGKRFRWSEPPEDGAPGQAIQCRCYAEPLVDELLENL